MQRIFNFALNKPYLFLALFSLVFLLPFIGNVHLFDWDEINFAESAREMLVTGDYFRVRINFEPFWEKPPLFFWLQVVSMKIFGVNEFAARFPNVLAGLATLLFLYKAGSKLISNEFGLFWALTYISAFLPFLYFKSGIIDPWFNLFIFISLYYLYNASLQQTEKLRNAIVAGLFCGLAIITKGPTALLIIMLVIASVWSFSSFKKILSFQQILLFGITVFAVSFLWFGYETIHNGPWFIVEFIKYQIDLFLNPVAGHSQPFFYHFVVVFIGCFPFSIIALSAFRKQYSSEHPYRLWMLALFWVVLILFSIVKTKIVHYSSLAYLPLSFLAATFLYKIFQEGTRIPMFLKVILLIFSLLFSLILFIVPFLFANPQLISAYIKDAFTLACLLYPVKWSGFEPLWGILFLSIALFSFYFLKRTQIQKYLLTISLGFPLVLNLYLFNVVPKIERHSQGPMIDYFSELSAYDCYATPYGFKSYAHYFYFKLKPENAKLNKDVNYLLNAPTSKNVFLISKVGKSQELDTMRCLALIRQEGGYRLWIKKN